jgi:hypothetical protein
MTKLYAGMGSRETPAQALHWMTSIAVQLAETGWKLRSGNARGADQAFQRGAPTSGKEIHLPWNGYNHGMTNNPSYIVPTPTKQMVEIAAAHHPAWDRLTDTVKMFMLRNTSIVLGADLLSPVKMVICWTPGAQLKGGTAHAMRIASTFQIPVFNLASQEDQTRLCNYVGEFYEQVEPDPPLPVSAT